MKLSMSFVLIVTMVLGLCVTANAGQPRRGKKVFNRVCGACHVEGSKGGLMKPSKKTMAEWKAFIKQNEHRCDKKVLAEMSAEDKENLISFLHDYALDSEVR